ncbi:MAG: matrixin family metalloprotease [Candidatus Binatia bacterium]
MKRLIIWVLTLAAIIGTSLLGAEPAEATQAHYRWKYDKVCVADYTGPWPVDSATYRWDAVPDLQLVWRIGASACPSGYQRIYVHEGNYGRASYCAGTYVAWGGCAEAHLYASDGTWEWLGDAYRMYSCKIRMNNYYYWNWDDKRSLIMHEIGHCLGLDHTTYWSSLMNTNRWYYYNYPTAYDKSEVEKRYPW